MYDICCNDSRFKRCHLIWDNLKNNWINETQQCLLQIEITIKTHCVHKIYGHVKLTFRLLKCVCIKRLLHWLNRPVAAYFICLILFCEFYGILPSDKFIIQLSNYIQTIKKLKKVLCEFIASKNRRILFQSFLFCNHFNNIKINWFTLKRKLDSIERYSSPVMTSYIN